MSPQVRRELERIRQRYFFEKANSYEAIWVLREAMSLAKTHEGLLDAMELAQTAEIRNLMTDGGWRACQRHLAH